MGSENTETARAVWTLTAKVNIVRLAAAIDEQSDKEITGGAPCERWFAVSDRTN